MYTPPVSQGLFELTGSLLQVALGLGIGCHAQELQKERRVPVSVMSAVGMSNSPTSQLPCRPAVRPHRQVQLSAGHTNLACQV